MIEIETYTDITKSYRPRSKSYVKKRSINKAC